MRLRWFAMAGLSAASLISAAACVPSPSFAQETKTFELPTLESSGAKNDDVVTIAISPIEQLLPNLTHFMRAIGLGGQSGFLKTALDGYTNGLDRNRPIGIFVNLEESGVPSVVAALPVSDIDAFLGGLELFGEAEDLGDGLYTMSIGANSIFAQEKDNWLYLSDAEEKLEKLPMSGANGLASKVAKHDLWLEVNVQNIPDELIDLITNQARTAFEMQMDQQSGDMSDEELEGARAQAETMMKNLEEMISGTEKYVLGWGIRPSDKSMTIDTGATFVEGSRLAKAQTALLSAKTKLSGAFSQENMLSMKLFQVIGPEDVAQMESSFESSLAAAYKAIEDNSESEAIAERAKTYVKRLMKIVVESGKEGSAESVLSVSSNPSLNVFAAIAVSDGSQVEALAKDLAAELAKENVPVKVELATGNHKGVTLHKLTAPLPDDMNGAGRKIFGDKLNVSIGTSPKAIYLSVGKTAEASLKSSLDSISSTGPESATPIKMRLNLIQILNFIQSIEANPIVESMLSNLNTDEDRVMVDTKMIDGGSVTRITIQEGVLKAIAGGVRAGMAAQGGDF